MKCHGCAVEDAEYFVHSTGGNELGLCQTCAFKLDDEGGLAKAVRCGQEILELFAAAQHDNRTAQTLRFRTDNGFGFHFIRDQREQRANMTPEQRAKKREHDKKYRANLSSEQLEKYRERTREYRADTARHRVSNMTPEQIKRQRERDKERYAKMTPEQRAKKRESYLAHKERRRAAKRAA